MSYSFIFRCEDGPRISRLAGSPLAMPSSHEKLIPALLWTPIWLSRVVKQDPRNKKRLIKIIHFSFLGLLLMLQKCIRTAFSTRAKKVIILLLVIHSV